MKKILANLVLLSVIFGPLGTMSSMVAFAEVGPVLNFESPTYNVGSINGQDGWIKTGSFDVEVTVGGKLRISDAITSGSFGDQTFAKPLIDSVGESISTNGAFLSGVKQPHFEMQFDFESALSSYQPGMHMSVSPDRGDGSRMSYLRFEDQAGGVHVYFDDVQGVSNPANFVETDIATISRTNHTIKLTLDAIEGPSNDVVKVYIDNTLVHTGTSWENYYRYDSESSFEQTPRIVKSVLFRESGTANLTDQGNGFLIDNLSLLSGPIPTEQLVCPVDTIKALVETVIVPATQDTDIFSSTSLINGRTYILKAKGTADAGDSIIFDARYSFRTPTSVTWTDAVSTYEGLGVSLLDLLVNGTTPWGNYSSSHEYETSIIGTGAPISLKINDTYAVNNTGNLSVDIYACNPINISPLPGTIHIFKFVDGIQAIKEAVNNVSFPMITPTYGNAAFTLGVGGWSSGDVDYEASTGTVHPAGFVYTANEDTTTGLVQPNAEVCDGFHPYMLVGYSTGNTLDAAKNNTPNLIAPTLTINGDQYMIVWNKTCALTPPVKVHILKYLDGVKATAFSAKNYQFPMIATWKTANLNGGVTTSGNYVLGNFHGQIAEQYGADTAAMNVPADYATSEITDNTSNVLPIGATCMPGKYRLLGYKDSSTSFLDATTKTLQSSAPIYTGITSDRYIIVYNETCPLNGIISGMKYNDLNRNGKKDEGEPGLSGWKIRLILDNDDEDSDNDSVVAVAVTDTNGNYSFTDVVPGTYEVRETHKKGWKRMSKNPKDIVIVAGTIVTNIDFGNAQKKKEEKEDNDKDDNRDEQSGKNYGNHEDKNENHENERKGRN